MTTATPAANAPAPAAEPVKKRGRPRKVVDDAVDEGKKTATRKASTKATKGLKDEDKSVKKGTKTAAAKSSSSSVKSTAGKKSVASATPSKKDAGINASKAAAAPASARATPAMPETSKILKEVEKKGTFRTSPPPASTPIPTPTPTPTSTPTHTSMPTSQKPTSLPHLPSHIPTSPKPSPPKPTPTKPPPPLRPTTIPLPNPPSHRYTPTPPRPAPQPTPLPNVDGKLHPKYRPAARRITAIMVSIPLLIVSWYELYRRYFGDKAHLYPDLPRWQHAQPPAGAKTQADTDAQTVSEGPAAKGGERSGSS